MANKGKYIWDAEKGAWVLGPEQGEAVDAVNEVKEEQSSDEDSVEESVAADEYTEEDSAEDSEEIIESSDEEAIEASVDEGDMPSSPDEDEVLESEMEEEGPRYKGFLIRTIAYIIDSILLFGISGGLAVLITGKYISPIISPEIPDDWLPAWIYVVISGIYFVGLWAWRGQTLGKRIIKAKIVRTDGSNIGLLRSIVRWVFWITPMWYFSPLLYGSQFIWEPIFVIIVLLFVPIIIFNRKKLGIHDFIAGTCVVSSQPEEIPMDDEDEYYEEDAEEEEGVEDEEVVSDSIFIDEKRS